MSDSKTVALKEIADVRYRSTTVAPGDILVFNRGYDRIRLFLDGEEKPDYTVLTIAIKDREKYPPELVHAIVSRMRHDMSLATEIWTHRHYWEEVRIPRLDDAAVTSEVMQLLANVTALKEKQRRMGELLDELIDSIIYHKLRGIGE